MCIEDDIRRLKEKLEEFEKHKHCKICGTVLFEEEKECCGSHGCEDYDCPIDSEDYLKGRKCIKRINYLSLVCAKCKKDMGVNIVALTTPLPPKEINIHCELLYKEVHATEAYATIENTKKKEGL